MSVSTISESQLSILLDIRHPLAYLALRPAAAIAREVQIGINWLPVVAPPLRPPTAPSADDDRGIRHRRYRAQAIAREIETYAAAQGLVLTEYYRGPNPAAVNLGWLWLRERHPERLEAFLIEAFRAYWGLELDPSSEAEVASLLHSLDVDITRFRAWCAAEGVAATAALADELREQGLSRVPCYIVEAEVFFGRQHLPMVRWILEGRAGPTPI